MPPTSSRDFQKAAAQRFIAAEALLRAKRNLDAQYIGGYTVECSLKALIMELTPDPEKADHHRSEHASTDCAALQIAESWDNSPDRTRQENEAFQMDHGPALREGTARYGRDHRVVERSKSHWRTGGGPIAVIQTDSSLWEARRTDETRHVGETLRRAGFGQVDAYRYDSASIRVRVIDRRFEGLKDEAGDAMVEPILEELPEQTQIDIIELYTFAPSELLPSPRIHKESMQNAEFDDPSPSML